MRALIALTAGLLLATSIAANAQTLGMGTSNPGSLFHSSGTAVAKVANEKGGIAMTVQPFASPNIFIPAINEGELAFGVANIWEVEMAVKGEAHFEGRANPDVKAVSIMYPLRVAIFVRADSDIKSIKDLKGKRLTTGFTSQRTIPPMLLAGLATQGLGFDDVEQVQVSNVVAGANAFMQGKADAFFFALGAAKVREANAAVGGIRALNIEDTPENVAIIEKLWPVGYLRAEKPGKPNPGVTEPINVITYDALVIASSKTSEDAVYRVTKAMHDNKADMAATFGVFNLFNPKRMNAKLPGVEWHPGAIKFYTEAGMWPPEG